VPKSAENKIDYSLWSKSKDIQGQADKAGLNILQYYLCNSDKEVDLDTVKMLIDSGAQANSRAFNGANALWFAAQSCCKFEVFEALLENGADANNKDNEDVDIASNYVLACETNQREIKQKVINLLLKWGLKQQNICNSKAQEMAKAQQAKLDEEFPKAEALITSLKEKTQGGGKFNYDYWKYDATRIHRSEGGVTLLMAFLDNNRDGVDAEAVKSIIDAGVDINYRDRDF
jgi:hypothetical protein